MALDSVMSLGHSVRMAEPETELEHKQRFILRVTESRTASGMKQWQIAEAMGIPQDKYKQYETRSLMPII
jgi:predicted XRE-type DNA-binding protein